MSGVLLKLCAFFIFITSPVLMAQSDNEESQDLPEEDVYTLSPFEISTAETSGYLATSTLAGSRINTDLKNIAASISIVTEDLIEDIGAVDLNDILVYMANTESTQNFTSAGERGTADNNADNPQAQNRVRGLGSADLTRDYFRSIGESVGIDAYNIERVTINRGPNSILYGLGNPSGVVNYRTKGAYIGNNAYEVSARYGSHDDVRGSFDINYQVVEDKLAVRLLGMASDRGFKQQPSHFRDNRISTAVIYKPFEGATFKLSYELVSQNQNHPNTITPIDHVTEYIRQGRPEWNAATDDYSARPDYLSSVQAERTVAVHDYDGNADYYFMGDAGNQRFTTVNQQNHDAVDIFTWIGFSDNKVADFHSLNMNPNGREMEYDGLLLTYDQKITDDLYANVGYYTEKLDDLNYYFTRGFEIRVDNNTHLPDGRVNPHHGETYIPQWSLDNRNVIDETNDMLRGTITYELDFETKFADSWLKWIGRHNFTALAESQETERDSKAFNEIRENHAFYLDASNRADHETWQSTRLLYLGGTADTPVRHAPKFPELGPKGVPHSYYNPDTGVWETDTYDAQWALKRHDIVGEKIESTGFIWQSYFWDGRIVGTAGWRKDKNTARQGTYNSIGDDGMVIDGNDTTEADPIEGDTSTLGIVVHPLSWLSVHYNESENFTPAASDVNMLGESVGPPSGMGEDYGFSLSLMDGKFNARVNWYKVEQVNSRLPWGASMFLAQWELLVIDEQMFPTLSAMAGVPYERQTPLSVGDGRIVTTADVVSEGMEIEIAYNPTENLRIMANIAQQDAVRSGIAKSVTRFLEKAMPYWQSHPMWDTEEYSHNVWGVEGNVLDWFNAYPAGRTLTYNADEGASNPQLREWRTNVIANYTFTDGRLSGWNFGGAVRYQSEAAIGFPTINNEEGLIVGLDLENAYTDDATLDLDLWVGMQRMIMDDKIKMNVQLNVRNVTRSEGFQAINANSDGTPSGFRIEFGPTWTLQSTFSW